MSARPLFTTAALFNFLVGLPMLVAFPLVGRVLGFEGPPTLWTQIVAAIVLVFGYAYWRIANDPVQFRPYVTLGIIGKLIFVVIIYAHWLSGTATGAAALLVTVDLAFALLFIAYLRASPR
jgi:hypothetical protein